MKSILSGMRVVEGSAFIAAPLGGLTLAQLGADVIRFDHIGGGLDYGRWPLTRAGHSLYWADLNKGKRSFAVNLRTPEGQELLSELVTAPGRDAGLFLTNFPPRGWLNYETLSQRRPDLIQLVIQGAPGGGTAVDYTVNARVGFPYMTGPGTADAPVNHVLPAWDCLTGQMAATGLLAAERHRYRTGKGQCITLALSDVALATLGNLAYISEVMVNDTDRMRHGNFLYGAFGKDFRTRNGERLILIGITRRQWRALLQATESEAEINALAEQMRLNFDLEGDRFTARREIAALFARWVGQRTLSEAAVILDEHQVCWGPYQTVRQLIENDPVNFAENPLFQTVEQPEIGRYPAPVSPLNFSAVAREPAGPAPRLGQHTDEILADILGLSSAEIGKLHEQGIVADAARGSGL